MNFPKPLKVEKVKKPLKRKSSGPLKKAKEKAWKVFSLWVRLNMADQNGMVKCVTCPVVRHYTEMHAGHFIPGRNNAVLFSEDGTHPQDMGCNVMKHGNWPEYYKYMKIMYGLEIIEELLEKSKVIIKYTIADFEEIEARYKAKIRDLRIESDLSI